MIIIYLEYQKHGKIIMILMMTFLLMDIQSQLEEIITTIKEEFLYTYRMLPQLNIEMTLNPLIPKL